MQMTGHKTQSVFERYNIVASAICRRLERAQRVSVAVSSGSGRKPRPRNWYFRPRRTQSGTVSPIAVPALESQSPNFVGKFGGATRIEPGMEVCRFNGVVIACCLVLVFGVSAPPLCPVFGPYWTTFGLRRRVTATPLDPRLAIPLDRSEELELVGSWPESQTSLVATNEF